MDLLVCQLAHNIIILIWTCVGVLRLLRDQLFAVTVKCVMLRYAYSFLVFYHPDLILYCGDLDWQVIRLYSTHSYDTCLVHLKTGKVVQLVIRWSLISLELALLQKTHQPPFTLVVLCASSSSYFTYNSI
jgi:hypothetical protein